MNTNITICTIIAKNYISFARTLCDSFLETHLNGKCFVLVVDDTENYINTSNESFELITLHDINVPNTKSLCFKYNVIELSTAIKPYFLEYLLTIKSVNKIIYLDPDILVTNTLEKLYSDLDNNDIILTPHLDIDFPDDGLLPDDSHIMKSGIFNLGFIGLKKCYNVHSFLLWWQKKLYYKCVIDFEKGYFVDQKFIDIAITLFPNIKIIKDDGYNVAYWNLHSRDVYANENTWMCNNKPLYFFHFSGYKPENPKNISIYQNRYSFKSYKKIENLFSYYRNQVLNNNYTKTKSWPYTFSCYNNGKKINFSSRYLYRIKENNLQINDPFDYKSYTFLYRIQSSLLWLRKAILFFIKYAYSKNIFF